eukprot:TRINITY_DN31702_c0_g1_i1.p1 TRINITY_DN31702_c0_g1~~TRINITY_DN31702_c0_g1_i1.p1  ORF type:complete len:223 (+),score=11.11 TRINITY_DN31702_c0_g1_i1:53-721(+)
MDDEELARRLQEQEQRKSARNFHAATLRSVGSSPALRRPDTARHYQNDYPDSARHNYHHDSYARDDGYVHGGLANTHSSFSYVPRQQHHVIVQQVPVHQPQPVTQTVYVQHVDAYGNPVSPPLMQPTATVVYQTPPPPPPQQVVYRPTPTPPPPPPPPPARDTPETDAQLALTLQQMEIDQAQSVRRQSSRREIQHTRGLGHGRDSVTPAKTKGCGGDCSIM